MSLRGFQYQRQSARQRGIAWELTYPEWLAIWEASGHWHERGRGRLRYCMARKGDIGPYSTANVYVCTNLENIRDFREVHGEQHSVSLRLGHLNKALASRGWTLQKKVTGARGGRPYQVTLGKKFIGSYATQEEAEHAHRVAVLAKLGT